MRGTVFLIGAGPGDPGLITARGLELLRVAEVVVYDRLAATELLALTPESCELVDAGKTAGDHTLGQEQINELLVTRALEGKVVVRLKGGDPFLFGRGGEEAAACHARKVPFEVVPGVTSAMAVPAYAGIPVTHRGVAQHATFVTASAGSDGTDDPDYAWLARSQGTVVLLMGLRRVAHVATSLIAAGAPASRPVAVISRGTTHEQRTVVGDLATIAARVEKAALASPAIIVVGDVVSLRDTLDWFERRPLFGTTITVTRARSQASDLVTSLRDLGAEVIECPMIRIEPLDGRELDSAITTLERRDFLLFTSGNGAELFFAALARHGLDARALKGLQVCVVGESTARICRANGISVDLMPPPGKRSGQGVIELLSGEALFGASLLLVRAEGADERLVEGLTEQGAKVELVTAYRNVVEVPAASIIAAAMRSDYVTFTAASTVRNFARLVPPGVPAPPAVTIGPVTTEAARQQAFRIAREAEEPSVAGIVVALLEEAYAANGAVRQATGASE